MTDQREAVSAFDKRIRELTDDAIRESLAEISAEFERRFGPLSQAGEQEAGEADKALRKSLDIATPEPVVAHCNWDVAGPWWMTRARKLENAIRSALSSLSGSAHIGVSEDRAVKAIEATGLLAGDEAREAARAVLAALPLTKGE